MPNRQQTARWVLTAVAVVAVLGLGAELAARRVVDAEFIRDRLAEEIGGADARVTVGDAVFSLFKRELVASDVLVSLPGKLTVGVSRVEASGLPVGGGEAAVREIGALDVAGLFVYLHPRPDSAGVADTTASGSGGASGAAGHPGSPDALRVGELRVRDGTALAWRIGATEGPRQVLIRELQVVGSGVTFDGSGRISRSDRLDWTTGPFLRTRSDGLTLTSMDSIRASTGDSVFIGSGVGYGPVHDDAEFFDKLEDREDRIRATIPRLEMRGVDFDALARRGLVVREASFDDIDVDVLSNRRVPAGPPDEPWLPRTLIARLDGPVRIDSVTLRGRIVYSEIPLHEVAEAARFAFEDFRCVVSGIADDPRGRPLVVDASMTVFGAPASIRLDIPLDSEKFVMRMQGRVRALPLSRLNALTIPLQGVEIQEGELEGLRFDITVDGPTAGGTVWVAYRDLDVQIVDSRTGEGGLLDDIKSFVANTFALRGENMPDPEGDEGAEPGTVEYYVRPTDPFFTRVWAPIRSGMMEVTKK